MAERFIDRFEFLLLDMGNTFMFGCDRFSDGEDFGAAYRRHGGSTLGDADVSRIIRALFDYMLPIARTPERYDDFPTVAECLRALPLAGRLPERERAALERVFSDHEMGEIPRSHAEALRRLRATHRLGVVSNIWSQSAPYYEAFERAGVRDFFDVVVFSSDCGCIKPSRRIFRAAMDGLGAAAGRTAFVGDSQKRDVAGAKALGLGAVWISPDGAAPDPGYPAPDLTVPCLCELAGC